MNSNVYVKKVVEYMLSDSRVEYGKKLVYDFEMNRDDVWGFMWDYIFDCDFFEDYDNYDEIMENTELWKNLEKVRDNKEFERFFMSLI